MMSAVHSNIIGNLRLPLMMMVVFIHSYLTKSDVMPSVIFIEDVFSKCIPIIAVPIFMFISGYLYFAKCKRFTPAFYKKQTVKRIRTLAVPYMVWNTIVICVFWCIHRFAPTIINPDFENISGFSISQLLDCYWRGSGGFPIAYQFWFIRDLFIIALASPVVYLIARLRYWGLAIVFALYMSTYSSYIEMGAYFFMGAYCATNNVDFSGLKLSWRVMLLLAYAVFACLYLAMNTNELIRKTLIFCGSISLLNWRVLKTKIDNRSLFAKLSGGAFFLFCLHGIVDLFSCKILTGFIHTHCEIIWIIAYFLNVIGVILFCLSIYWIMKKLTPRFLMAVTGNR